MRPLLPAALFWRLLCLFVNCKYTHGTLNSSGQHFEPPSAADSSSVAASLCSISHQHHHHNIVVIVFCGKKTPGNHRKSNYRQAATNR
jgi:hypothetical protein